MVMEETMRVILVYGDLCSKNILSENHVVTITHYPDTFVSCNTDMPQL